MTHTSIGLDAAMKRIEREFEDGRRLVMEHVGKVWIIRLYDREGGFIAKWTTPYSVRGKREHERWSRQ